MSILWKDIHPLKKKLKTRTHFQKKIAVYCTNNLSKIGIHGKKESAPAMKEKFHFEGTTNSLKLGNNAS